MTSVTSILGAVPLAIATGAGAESRQPIGMAVAGGLTFSTAFTLLIIPVMYLLVVGMAERLGINTIPPAVTLADDFEADLGNTAQPVQTRQNVGLEPEDRRSAAL